VTAASDQASALARGALRADAPKLAVFDTRSGTIWYSGGRVAVVDVCLALPSGSVAACRRHHRRRPEPASLTLATDEYAPAARGGELTIRPPHRCSCSAPGPSAALLDIARARWACCIVDHRERCLRQAYRSVDRRLSQRPTPALRELAAERFDAALVMTHVADADLGRCALAGEDIAYIGLRVPAGGAATCAALLGHDALNGLPRSCALGGEDRRSRSPSAELQKLVICA
jgi:hypothetical protein